MNVALPWIIAFFFMITTVICGVNWAFDAYEKKEDDEDWELVNSEEIYFCPKCGRKLMEA